MLAIGLQGSQLLGGHVGDQTSGVGGSLKEDGRLRANNLHIICFADIRIAHVHQLHNLALGDHIGSRGKGFHHRHIPDVNHHLKGAGVDKITHQNAGRITPFRIGSGTSPPEIRGINDIIMEQCGGVQEFDNRSQRNVLLTLVLTGARTQKYQ